MNIRLSPRLRKLAAAVPALALALLAGLSFHRSRNLKEPLVLGPGVSRVARLGDYFRGIRGTVNDCRLYVLEGKEPGGTVLILGGTHPEEPAGRIAAWIIAENAVVEQGRLIVVPSANRSATTVTRLGGAYPPDYSLATPWGRKTFRMGDRWSNPLDQWPDPEVYIHYPSRQELAYVDVRNLNRAWPGRPGGTLTERTCHAFTRLIVEEKVDIVIDLHEAELQYPVINVIVAHEKGFEIASEASMMIEAFEGFKIGMEKSPPSLRGLSHREIGDHTPAVSLLLEAPEPFLDATRGRTDRRLLLEGRDEFVAKAGRHGLLFETIDERGWPIDVRVGRHCSTILHILEVWSGERSDRAVALAGLPRHDEVVSKTAGSFLHDPRTVPASRISYE